MALKNYLGDGAQQKKSPEPPRPVDTVDDIAGKIVALLEKSHCFYAELLDKLPKADYKTIASAVGQLYQEGKIGQDKDGKYKLRGSPG